MNASGNAAARLQLRPPASVSAPHENSSKATIDMRACCAANPSACSPSPTNIAVTAGHTGLKAESRVLSAEHIAARSGLLALSAKLSAPRAARVFLQNNHPATPRIIIPCSVSEPGLNHWNPHQ